jgi:hypothetical protein
MRILEDVGCGDGRRVVLASVSMIFPLDIVTVRSSLCRVLRVDLPPFFLIILISFIGTALAGDNVICAESFRKDC